MPYGAQYNTYMWKTLDKHFWNGWVKEQCLMCIPQEDL